MTSIDTVISSDKFDRPWHLAQDHTRTEDVVKHVLSYRHNAKYKWVVLLQPTSPLRTPEDVTRACELAAYHDADSVVSMCYEGTHRPKFWYGDVGSDGMCHHHGDLLCETLWRNGSIYITKVSFLMEHDKMFSRSPIPYIMPPEKSMDINTEFDFYLAECAAKRLMEAGEWPKTS